MVSGFSFTLGKLGELSDLKLPWLDRSRHLDFQLSGLTRGPRRHSAGSMDLMADTYAVTPRRAIRSPWPRGKSAARSGSRRKAFIRACATRFMLHPINSAQSQFEYRSKIDMTKTKRSKAASLVTLSIWRSLCASRCPALQSSRL